MAPELAGQGPSTVDDHGPLPPLHPPQPPRSIRHSLPLPPPHALVSSKPSLPGFSTTASISAPEGLTPQQISPQRVDNNASDMSNHHRSHYPHDYPHHGANPHPPLPALGPSLNPYHHPPPSHSPYHSYGQPNPQPGHDVRLPNLAASSSMTLPSMRTLDSMAPQTSPYSQGPNSGYASGLIAPAPANVQPYLPGNNLPPVLSSNYGCSAEELARYALPPDHRNLPRPPKKDIKRRTKTGCLTCRKRRIKCDETHPSCNNCKKSKRDCLGYDPVFRIQNITQGGPEIPRSSSALSTESYHTAPYSEPSYSPGPSTPGAPPLQYHNYYGNRSASLGDTHTTPSDSQPSSSAAPYRSASHQRDLLTPLTSTSPRLKVESTEDHCAGSYSNYPRLPPVGQLRDPTWEERTRNNKMSVDDVISGLGPPPATPVSIIDEATYQEVVKVYHEMYAPGFSAFFESTWFYFSDNGKMSFPRSDHVVKQVATFLKVTQNVKVGEFQAMSYSSILELRMVWELTKMMGLAAPENMTNITRQTLPPESDPVEARNRFLVVDALLAGKLIPWNFLTPPVQDANPHRQQEFDFWHNLAQFVTVGQTEGFEGDQQGREQTLKKLRLLLHGRENRDVLYSIAVLRLYSPQFNLAQAMQTTTYHPSEDDRLSKVVVAAKFISLQAQVTGGNTNVVRRICDIAVRTYIHPRQNPQPSC